MLAYGLVKRGNDSFQFLWRGVWEGGPASSPGIDSFAGHSDWPTLAFQTLHQMKFECFLICVCDGVWKWNQKQISCKHHHCDSSQEFPSQALAACGWWLLDLASLESITSPLNEARVSTGSSPKN